MYCPDPPTMMGIRVRSAMFLMVLRALLRYWFRL